MDQSNKIKVIFLLPTLVAGGSERIMSFIAQNLDKRKFEPILIITAHKKDAAYNVSDIKVKFLEKSRVLFSVPKIIINLFKERPHVVISAGGHLNTLMAYISFLFPKTKFVAREVNVLSVLSKFIVTKGNILFRFLGKHRFKYFDKIICQSQDMKSDILKNFKANTQKLIVINNPITKGFHPKKSREINKVVNFITVARLVRQKGHERIINSLVQFKNPFHYTIVGDGAEKANIFALIEKYNMSKNITHIPFTKNVKDYLDKADLYLQGSYVEGFPNAIVESLATGTPVLAFNALGGINELIIDGVNGYIVENEQDFVARLNQISLKYEFDINEVSKSVYEKYEASIILKKYEELLINC